MSKRNILRVIFGIILIAAGAFVVLTPYDNWNGVKDFGWLAGLSVFLALVLRGRLRDLSVLAASVLIGLSCVEAFAVVREARPIEIRSPGYSVSEPVLGWGPQHPGVFHQTKLAVGTRHVIYDVDYGIDQNLHRNVTSTDTGPVVAFFGDSMTFGTGLNDGQTLPQAFADLYDRKVGVMNFGFPGYGPQQYLRALESGIDDKLLRDRVRLFVYETSGWHAERSACTPGFMLRAPRYLLVGEHPVFSGACYRDWWTMPIQVLANTAFYRVYIDPIIGAPSHAAIELYIAIVARAGQIAKERYGARTLILYLPTDEGYLRRSGFTDREIMDRMRSAGLDVIDAGLDQNAYPGQPLKIPGDGHPTAVANAARAAMIKTYLEKTKPDLLLSTSN